MARITHRCRDAERQMAESPTWSRRYHAGGSARWWPSTARVCWPH